MPTSPMFGRFSAFGCVTSVDGPPFTEANIVNECIGGGAEEPPQAAKSSIELNAAKYIFVTTRPSIATAYVRSF